MYISDDDRRDVTIPLLLATMVRFLSIAPLLPPWCPFHRLLVFFSLPLPMMHGQGHDGEDGPAEVSSPRSIPRPRPPLKTKAALRICCVDSDFRV